MLVSAIADYWSMPAADLVLRVRLSASWGMP